jgi:hypothetical protein
MDITWKERLDLVHAKQLCLLCLQHLSSVGWEVAGRRSNCPAKGCDRPHHVTLNRVLKAVRFRVNLHFITPEIAF